MTICHVRLSTLYGDLQVKIGNGQTILFTPFNFTVELYLSHDDQYDQSDHKLSDHDQINDQDYQGTDVALSPEPDDLTVVPTQQVTVVSITHSVIKRQQ